MRNFLSSRALRTVAKYASKLTKICINIKNTWKCILVSYCLIIATRLESSCFLNEWIFFLDTNRPYECEACKIRYMNFGDLKKHMRLHHPDATIPENILEQKPSLKCPTCMRMFKCPLKLEQHILLHSGGAEKFQCELCPMLYSNSLVLKQHYSINHRGMPMPLHLTTKIFSNCTICERKCKSASDLENHMKMHTGIHINRLHSLNIKIMLFICRSE